MILPLWYSDRKYSDHSLRLASRSVHCYPLPGDAFPAAYLVSNTSMSGRDLFRQETEYETFIRLIDWHLGCLARLEGGLLTPCSYEMVIRLLTNRELTMWGDGLIAFPQKPFSAMLSHYVLSVNRKYGQRGALFTRGFRLERLGSSMEVNETLSRISTAADAMQSAFPIPVMLL